MASHTVSTNFRPSTRHLQINTIKFMNAFLCDHFFRLAFHDDFSTGETDDLVGKIDRLIDVMKDHNDGHAKFPVQPPHKLQNLDLITDIRYVVGSSRKRISVPCASAMAIQARWRCPPESLDNSLSRNCETLVTSMAQFTYRSSSSHGSPSYQDEAFFRKKPDAPR